MTFSRLVSGLVEDRQPSIAEVTIHMPHDRQGENYTCGPAALGMVLYYFGIEMREDKLADALKTSKNDGTSATKMAELARRRGLKAEVVRGMSTGDLRAAVRAGKPAIVAFQAWGPGGTDYVDAWEHGHYAVVVGAGDLFIYFDDPATRSSPAYLTVREFERRWHDVEDDERVHRLAIVFEGRKKNDSREIVKVG
jgi:ABC-type bacteriocin/lantibiotic exporter with double-glycine peptidase domain